VGEVGSATVGCGVTWKCSYNRLFSFGLHSWPEEIHPWPPWLKAEPVQVVAVEWVVLQLKIQIARPGG